MLNSVVKQAPRLRIGALPSPDELAALTGAGYRGLLNVSGIDLEEMYPGSTLCPFKLMQFTFVDVFSAAPAWSADTNINAELYTNASSTVDQQQFLAAVKVLTQWLAGDAAVFICCHRGEGRSPAVTSAGLLCVYGGVISDVFSYVSNLRPQAKLTAITAAAMTWAQRQLSPSLATMHA